MSTATPLDALSRALDATGRVVDGLGDGRWSAATCCPPWTVRELLDHLVGVHAAFAALLAGERPPPTGTDHLGADPVAAYRGAADAVRTAFAAPGVLEAEVSVPFGRVPGAVALELLLTETLTHGWDLARASGRPVTDLPADLAERALAFSRGALADLPPDRSPFAPPRPVDAGAPAVDRLAALLGRPPGPAQTTTGDAAR